MMSRPVPCMNHDCAKSSERTSDLGLDRVRVRYFLCPWSSGGFYIE